MFIERYHPLIGGSENQCRLLVAALHQQGVPVIVLTRKALPDLDRITTIDGVPVFRLPPSGFGRIWIELLFSLHALVFLFRRRRDYDILHLHSGTSIAGALTITLAQLLRKKTVIKIATAGDVKKNLVEIHERSQKPSLAHRLVNSWINQRLRAGSKIVCISKEIHREAEQHHFTSQQTVYIPNAVDIDRFTPSSDAEKNALRETLGLPTKKLMVLFSGRLIQRKGVDVLLDAWYHLGALHDRAFLAILGSGSSSLDTVEPSLRSFVQDQHLQDSVMFIGETPAPEHYLRAADLFVFPSRREGLPNALLEAMSCGLPIIASAIGGNVDLIRDGENGLLAPSEDSTALAQSITRLLNNNELRSRLGSQARHDIASTMSISSVAQHYLSLYRTLTHAE